MLVVVAEVFMVLPQVDLAEQAVVVMEHMDPVAFPAKTIPVVAAVVAWVAFSARAARPIP